VAYASTLAWYIFLMATITIASDQASNAASWPDLCVYCGQPSSQRAELPPRYSGKQTGLMLPMCEQHARRPSRVGLGMGLATAVVALWVVGSIAGIGATVSLSLRGPQTWELYLGLLFAALPAGILLGWWAAPVRVIEEFGHSFNLSGVDRRFAAAWRAWAVRRADERQATGPAFAVRPYRPEQVCSIASAVHLLAVSLGVGGVAGIVVGWATLLLSEFIVGWSDHDYRFLALIAGCTIIYSAVALQTFGFRVLSLELPHLVRSAVVLSLAALGVAAFAWLMSLAVLHARKAVPLATSFHIVWYGAPLMLAGIARVFRVRTTRVRHGVVAAIGGLVAPLALAAGILGMTWDLPGSTIPLMMGAAVCALVSGTTGYLEATSPYCRACDQWMIRQVLGGVSQPAGDVMAMLQRGQLPAPVEGASVKVPPGDVELAVFYCEKCRVQGEVVLEATSIPANRKTRRVRLGWWVFPVSVWDELHGRFPSALGALARD
jgi:hypothetical protein